MRQRPRPRICSRAHRLCTRCIRRCCVSATRSPLATLPCTAQPVTTWGIQLLGSWSWTRSNVGRLLCSVRSWSGRTSGLTLSAIKPTLATVTGAPRSVHVRLDVDRALCRATVSRRERPVPIGEPESRLPTAAGRARMVGDPATQIATFVSTGLAVGLTGYQANSIPAAQDAVEQRPLGSFALARQCMRPFQPRASTAKVSRRR